MNGTVPQKALLETADHKQVGRTLTAIKAAHVTANL